MMPINQVFAGIATSSRWQTYITGNGRLESTGCALRFTTDHARSDGYTNVQIDDYQDLPRRRFRWHPPLRLTVRARFSGAAGELCGTAGFGFWNDPLLMTHRRVPALPRAIWFFYASAPSEMKLDFNTPGRGWKAATIDAMRCRAIAWAPFAPLAVPLMNLTPVYRKIWPRIQQDLRIRETVIPNDMRQWHTYELCWGVKHSLFRVHAEGEESSEPILVAASPRGPMGFVMWQDNQYLVVTPWGRIKWGLLDVPGHQWMEVDDLEIAPLEDVGPLLGPD
jgi:hypothetical protein